MKKEQVISKMNPLLFQGICHRGYHNERDTENGLKAFQNAIDHHTAFELDVHLTKDNRLVVIHDSETKRVTGKDGIIEEMTLEEIKNGYRLLDGEEIPTLEEVLDLTNEQVPIVVELKAYQNNNRKLAKQAQIELSKIKDPKNILIISFDPRALLFMGKRFIRQLLVAHDNKHEFTFRFAFLFEGVDLDMKFLKEEKYQNYQKKHVVNCWTIETIEQFEEVLPHCDTVTFQSFDCETVKEKLSERNKH